MAQLPNSLETAELGSFEEDPSADTLLEFAQKFNTNTELLDPVVGTVTELDQNMDGVEAKGLLSGSLYGGSY